MSEVLNKVSQAMKDVAAQFESAVGFDDDGAAVLPETWVKDNLALASGSEELSLETVNLVQNTEATFAGGIALGLGNSGLKRMQEKADLERVSASVDFGSNTIRASVDRQIMVRAPGSTEEKPKHGNVSVKLDSGAAAKKGDLKRVVTHVNEAFTAAFSK
ncbi:hypothetical protein PA10_00103 [Pseudomonas phage pPa_SNUABM_DT01]|nr:hypothetical protein PA10_00103 [Pseudomonas phage pPa_SNUABM_DT01]